MKETLRISRFFVIGFVLVLGGLTANRASAGGISADAGLTPARDRWILRSQIRYVQRGNTSAALNSEVKSYIIPMVVAYGLLPELTLIVRQGHMNMNMTVASTKTSNSGFGDLLVMAKYKAYRFNSQWITFGMAVVAGIEFPTGQASFSSNGLDLKTGLFFSARRGPWGSDLNLIHTANGVDGGDDQPRNGELEAIWAIARQFTIGQNSNITFAPVLELAFTNESRIKLDGVPQPNTGESVFLLSPGAKYTQSSLIFEFLLQIPVWQDQNGIQRELKTGGLFGIRLML